MLIGFVVPRLFARMSRIPASSRTARTPPPAITPVPSLAGRSSTRAASERPRISCVIVVPCFGTVKRFFFESSTAFDDLRDTVDLDHALLQLAALLALHHLSLNRGELGPPAQNFSPPSRAASARAL